MFDLASVPGSCSLWLASRLLIEYCMALFGVGVTSGAIYSAVSGHVCRTLRRASLAFQFFGCVRVLPVLEPQCC